MVYLIFFGLLIVGCNLLPKGYVRQNALFFAILIWLIMGLRSIDVGPDTLGYCLEFVSLTDTSFSDLLRQLSEKKEPLYLFVTWGLAQISFLYPIFLLFWSSFSAYAIYKIQKQELQHSMDIAISYISFFLLGLFVFFTAGIRQTFAISMALLSYQYLKEPFNGKFLNKDLLHFTILIFIGYLIHKTILIFAILYPLKGLLQKTTIKWWYIIPVIALYPIGRSVTIDEIQLLAQYLFGDDYLAYGTTYESSWSASAFMMQMILFLICFVVKNRLMTRNPSNILLLNIVLIGLVFQSMSGTLAEMARVSYYFSIFYIILLPRAIYELSSKGKNQIINIAFIFVSLIYLFFLTSANLPKFSFFWDVNKIIFTI